MNAVTEICTNAITTLNLPRVGLIWPEHHGFFCGITGGQEGRPFYALILPDDARVHFEDVELGTYGIDVEGAKSKHDGRANTMALAEAGSDLCQKILQLEVAGQTDLFLPASQDALVMAANAPQLLSDEDWYLTSTTIGARSVRIQDFEGGRSYDDTKVNERRAVAFRRIQLSN